MVLVAYSDSEGSDTESAPAPVAKPKDSTTSAGPKSSFQKVVDRSQPNKIRVNLPGSSTGPEHTTDAGEDDIQNDRPAKRSKTSSAFSGFNSFLPAPKNTSKPVVANETGSGTSLLARNRGTGLGQGIHLKTGAAPAFSREAPPPATDDGGHHSYNHYADVQEYAHVKADPVGLSTVQKGAEAVRKPMFKPLSVARKPPKKKKATSDSTGVPSLIGTSSNQKPSSNGAPKSETPVSRPKQSLFSTFAEDMSTVNPSRDSAQYVPEFSEPVVEEDEDESQMLDYERNSVGHASTAAAIPPSALSNDLQALADNLGLTPAQRRQLFGRNGVAQAAQVSNFSLAAEYSHNNALRESEAAAPAHNPVRAIAPGKHSLQQLVNAATSQKEALEESFASGRRNKKEAGSKYGW